MSELVDTEYQAYRNPKGKKRVEIVPYGYDIIDRTMLMGQEPDFPHVKGIQAASGNRKTTVVFNLIANAYLSGKMDMPTELYTMESGMSVERMQTIFRCIVATKLMAQKHYYGSNDEDKLWNLSLPTEIAENPDLIKTVKEVNRPIFDLRPESIKFVVNHYASFTSLQEECYKMAGDIIRKWPISLFGPSEHKDPEIRKSRAMQTKVFSDTMEHVLKNTSQRWLIFDYIQGFEHPEGNNVYYKMRDFTPKLAMLSTDFGCCVTILSQEGVKGTAYGGNEMMQECQVLFKVSYDQVTNPYFVKFEYPIKSREGIFPSFYAPICPSSGAIFNNCIRREM